MKAMTKRVLDRLEKVKGWEDIKKQHPGMTVLEPAPGSLVVCEDIRKPWEPGGPTVVPEPRPVIERSRSAELPPKKHPIEEQLEERQRINDFWNSLK